MLARDKHFLQTFVIYIGIFFITLDLGFDIEYLKIGPIWTLLVYHCLLTIHSVGTATLNRTTFSIMTFSKIIAKTRQSVVMLIVTFKPFILSNVVFMLSVVAPIC